jgi:hypothetical protein
VSKRVDVDCCWKVGPPDQCTERGRAVVRPPLAAAGLDPDAAGWPPPPDPVPGPAPPGRGGRESHPWVPGGSPAGPADRSSEGRYGARQRRSGSTDRRPASRALGHEPGSCVDRSAASMVRLPSPGRMVSLPLRLPQPAARGLRRGRRRATTLTVHGRRRPGGRLDPRSLHQVPAAAPTGAHGRGANMTTAKPAATEARIAGRPSPGTCARCPAGATS